MAIVWTEELVDRVRALWDEDIPASRIAQLIGQGATKNTIIGKAHRLRLRMRRPSPGTHPPGLRRPIKRPKPRPSRAKAPPKPPPSRSEAPPARPKLPPPPPPPPPPIVEPRLPQGMYTLLDLDHRTCKWPTNSPPRGSSAYFFCGEPTIDGRPYCVLHCELGYQRGSAPRRQEVGAWVAKPVEFR